MKFKEYLKEAHKEKESHKEWEMMLDLYVPLKPSYFKLKKNIVYRIAGENSAKNILKNQKKKILYSGFWNGSEALSRGISSGGDFLWELEGDIVFRGEYDFFTYLDRNGYKWFSSNYFKTKMRPRIEKYFEKNWGNKILGGWYASLVGTYFKGTDLQMAQNSPELKKIIGKRKQDFIKWYYDESKKILNLKKSIKIIKDEIESNKSITWQNDEVVFNNYIVKGVFITIANNKNITRLQSLYDTIKDLNIKFKGFIKQTDISMINVEKGIKPDKFVYFIKEIK